MKLVWKLLRQHISIPQFLGFFFANLIGVAIILIGIQFYHDYNEVYKSEDSLLMKDDFMIINKKVGISSTITGAMDQEKAAKLNSFSQEELEELKSQPFIKSDRNEKKFGVFVSSSYKVKVGFQFEDNRLSTDLFFESVDDAFVDVDMKKWNYYDGDDVIPIIIPKTYIDLYNFGFAQSHNMPRVAEGILAMVNIEVYVQKPDGQYDTYHGEIVGFSNRLNTVLVPMSFMKYANRKYARNRTIPVSRVVFQVDDPTDEKILKYLDDNDYETDQAKLDASKANYLMKLLLVIVIMIGAVICVLAFFILMLSIFLLVEKNSEKLENLLLIGYSPYKVALPYQILTIVLNLVVVLLAMGAVLVLRGFFLDLLRNISPQMSTPSIGWSPFVALGLCVFMSLLNVVVIHIKIMSIWNKNK